MKKKIKISIFADGANLKDIIKQGNYVKRVVKGY